MARKQTAQPATAGQAQARALVDLPDLGAQAGQLLEAEPLVVAALVAAGKADDHPDAVAYARGLAD